MILKNKIAELADRLMRAGIDDPRRAARAIIEHAAGISRAIQLSDPETVLTAAQIEQIDTMTDRRLRGEPLSRILGHREFYGLDFLVSPATLDPRPETELLVDRACAALDAHLNHTDLVSILDLGTGTGCIPISILTNYPQARAVAVDISPDALAVAASNARAHGVADRLAFIQSDWFSALSHVTFDLVVSNPPYIAADVVPTLDAAVRDFDPALALVGGVDGMDPYRRIFADMPRYLKPQGLGLFEIGYDQAAGVRQLAQAAGLDVCGVWDDDAGIPRVVGVRVGTG